MIQVLMITPNQSPTHDLFFNFITDDFFIMFKNTMIKLLHILLILAGEALAQSISPE